MAVLSLMAKTRTRWTGPPAWRASSRMRSCRSRAGRTPSGSNMARIMVGPTGLVSAAVWTVKIGVIHPSLSGKMRNRSAGHNRRTRAYSSWTQLAVGVAGAGAFQQEDHPVRAQQQDVNVHDGAVAIRLDVRCRVRFARRTEGLACCHDRKA
jgi:hypothetical protein